MAKASNFLFSDTFHVWISDDAVMGYIAVFGSGLLGAFLFQFFVEDKSFPSKYIKSWMFNFVCIVLQIFFSFWGLGHSLFYFILRLFIHSFCVTSIFWWPRSSSVGPQCIGSALEISSVSPLGGPSNGCTSAAYGWTIGYSFLVFMHLQATCHAIWKLTPKTEWELVHDVFDPIEKLPYQSYFICWI